MRKSSLIIKQGQIFGNLVVLHKTKYKHSGSTVWALFCSCGKITYMPHNSIPRCKSCGCMQHENLKTHNMSKTRIYKAWSAMKYRCDNPDDINYKEYGGRGITYSHLWKSFENFLEDMKYGYEENLTLDRVDVNGDYSKENCRWIGYSLQNHNKRKRKNCYCALIGVSKSPRIGKWCSSICINGKKNHIGTFKTQESAALAYDNASELYYGDRPNKTVREE